MKIQFKFDKEKLRQSARAKKADIDKIIEESIKETEEQSTSIMQKAYDESGLGSPSGFLYNSYQTIKTATSLKVFSTVIYSRIQDIGGWAGRNHSAYIRPKFYFTNGAKQLKEYFMQRIRSRFKKS